MLRLALRMAWLYEFLRLERASWIEIPFNVANFKMALSSRNLGQFALSSTAIDAFGSAEKIWCMRGPKFFAVSKV